MSSFDLSLSSAKDGEEELDGRASPPPPALASRMTSVGTTLPPLTAKEKPPINVVGDVGGKGRRTDGLTLSESSNFIIHSYLWLGLYGNLQVWICKTFLIK